MGAVPVRATGPRYLTLGSALVASFSSLFVIFPPSIGLKWQTSTQAVMVCLKPTRSWVEAPVFCTWAGAFLFFFFFLFFCLFVAPSGHDLPPLLGLQRGQLSQAALCSQKKKWRLFFLLSSQPKRVGPGLGCLGLNGPPKGRTKAL